MGYFDGMATLVSRINKVDDELPPLSEGINGIPLDEIRLDMDDDKILGLTKQWESLWNTKKGTLESRRRINLAYWKGEPGILRDYWGDQRPLADNLIFESLETFLPVATRKNPEPIVDGGDGELEEQLAQDVRKMLIYQTDRLRLKTKMKKGVRNWAIFLQGVWKIGWDEIEDDIAIDVIRPQNLILDPEGSIDDNCFYTGDFLGEYKKCSADEMTVRFPDKKQEILDAAQGKKGTELVYVEWWTDEYMFCTMQDIVLAKYRNPHWNYGGKEKIVDENGVESEREVPGNNHFRTPKMPYLFLTIFDLQMHPWDETSLIEQNSRLQDIVNKRIKQIDRNADNMNGGLRVSGDHFTQEEAGLVAQAEMDGDAIWVPQGDVNQAVSRIQSPGLPGDVYNSLQDARNEIRGIFGTSALTAQGISSTETVRGKIMARTADDSRIGGGVTEFIEQVYDSIYNYMVQMMYVYYNEDHAASVLGEENGREYIALRNDRFKPETRLIVSVKEGSLIPEDPLTKRNEAIDLWTAGIRDPIRLFKALGDANPVESAKRAYLFEHNPAALFPELAGQAVGQGTTVGAEAISGGGAVMPSGNDLTEAQANTEMASSLANVPIDGQTMPSA